MMAVLIQGSDLSKECALRLVTNVTLDAENQARLGQSAMMPAIVRLLASPAPAIRTLAAWCLANLSVVGALSC
jgi:epoxyqueuosine reductase QueG